MEFAFEFFDFPFEIFIVMKERCVVVPGGTKIGLDNGKLGAKKESPFDEFICINKHAIREEECKCVVMMLE